MPMNPAILATQLNQIDVAAQGGDLASDARARIQQRNADIANAIHQFILTALVTTATTGAGTGVGKGANSGGPVVTVVNTATTGAGTGSLS